MQQFNISVLNLIDVVRWTNCVLLSHNFNLGLHDLNLAQVTLKGMDSHG